MLRRNVLIFHSGALGDFILTWPFALTLARLYPQSRIYYVTSPQKGALAERALRLEWTDVDAGWHQLFADDPNLPAAAAKLLDNAHTVLSFVAARANRWEENLRRLAPHATLSCLDQKIPGDFTGHMTQWLLQQWAPWPAAHAGGQQILQSLQSRGLGLGGSGRRLLIHPGAGSAAKRWPIDNFVEVARCQTERGATVEFVVGEVELEQFSVDDFKLLESVATVHRPATLLGLFELLRGSGSFLGNDSGPAHLAGIMGVTTTCLFGPMRPENWKPLGPKVTALDGVGRDLPTDRVLQHLDTR